MVELFEIVPLKEGQTHKDLPKPDLPYFFLTKEGVYVYKQTVFGPTFLPTDLKEAVKNLPSIGTDYKGGLMTFTAPRVPLDIMNKAYSFFRKQYEKDGTEAEVLLLWNDDEQKYDLFVPTQRCSGTSVHHIYDEGEIPEGYAVVGSMHSHCDMDSFHSGTDDHDEESANGLHVTIGHITSELNGIPTPDFDAIVTNNKAKFKYDDIASVAEIDGLAIVDIPDDWFEAVTKEIPVQKKGKFNERAWNNFTGSDYGVRYWGDWAGWNRGNDDLDDAWEKYKNSRETYDQMRWVNSMQILVNRDWVNEKTGRIRPEFFKAAFEKWMNKVQDIAASYDYWFMYEAGPYEDDDQVDPDVDSRGDFERELERRLEAATRRELLPGPMSVD